MNLHFFSFWAKYNDSFLIKMTTFTIINVIWDPIKTTLNYLYFLSNITDCFNILIKNQWNKRYLESQWSHNQISWIKYHHYWPICLQPYESLEANAINKLKYILRDKSRKVLCLKSFFFRLCISVTSLFFLRSIFWRVPLVYYN